MGILNFLFGKTNIELNIENKKKSIEARERVEAFAVSTNTMSSGDLITDICNGENLVNGKETYTYANSEHNKNLATMLACHKASLKESQLTGLGPAPYYAERVAMLLGQMKRFDDQIAFIKEFELFVENFYSSRNTFWQKNNSSDETFADIRRGGSYVKMLERLPKAIVNKEKHLLHLKRVEARKAKLSKLNN